MTGINRSNIWMFRQNKPSLVVRDLKELYPDIDEDAVYNILLKRGVFKWFAARRSLIKLKNKWKEEVRSLNRRKNDKEKGYLHAMERCRKEIREITHSERWIAQDNDLRAIGYLLKITPEKERRVLFSQIIDLKIKDF